MAKFTSLKFLSPYIVPFEGTGSRGSTCEFVGGHDLAQCGRDSIRGCLRTQRRGLESGTTVGASCREKSKTETPLLTEY